MRKNIYKWHRTISLIIAIPVLLWAASGFMHPIMTTIRPKVGTQFLQPQAIDSSKIKVPLQEALTTNNITTFSNFRIVQMGGKWFYQVQLPGQNVLQYISTQNGQLLNNGDELYARSLAKQFLQGAKAPEKLLLASLNNNISLNEKDSVAEEVHDCCINATAAIMNDTSGAKITKVQLVTNFDNEYKYINRLLPAYKVSFDRADGIRIYVETIQDRFAFAMDNKRAGFDKFFSLFHTMGWLDTLGKGKLVVEIILALLAFLTTVMGIYIFCITNTKKPNGNAVVAAKRNHRWTSIFISLFTLMFTFSGAYHAFSKFSPDTRDRFFTSNKFMPADAGLNYTQLQIAAGTEKSITNISLVKIDGKNYWQVFNKSNKPGLNKIPGEGKEGDLMKRKSAPPPTTIYINTQDYSILPGGEMKYAAYLANTFSKHTKDEIVKTAIITKFEGEYGFVNKRLPVWKVNYASNHNERLYIETSTGKLAASVNDVNLVEGYSFALLHKHEFMAWVGKPVKDFSTMFWAMAQIAMVAVGLTLYFKIRKQKRLHNEK